MKVVNGPEDIIRLLLEHLDPNPTREGLAETPARVVKAWGEWTAGYAMDGAALLKTFEDGAKGVNQMVYVGPVEMYSHCEHHLAPFFGVAHVAYIPDGKIVGLSKLARLVDVFSLRLQVQERITNEIADTIWDTLKPKGVGVVLEAKHFCMCSRGVRKQGGKTITSALHGLFLDDPSTKSEFLRYCGY